MSDASESPKGYRYPKLVIGHAVYLYHRLPISYRDVQELLFKRGIEVSHETVRGYCSRNHFKRLSEGVLLRPV